MSRRLSFTERRRNRLARHLNLEDRLEPRTTITEPISLTALALHLPLGLEGLLGLSAVAVQAGPRLAGMTAREAKASTGRAESGNAVEARHAGAFLDLAIVPRSQAASPAKATASGIGNAAGSLSSSVKMPVAGDWLGLTPISGNPAGSQPTTAARQPMTSAPASGAGGGANGSNVPSFQGTHGAISPLRFGSPSSSGASSALMSAAGSAGMTSATTAGSAQPTPVGATGPGGQPGSFLTSDEPSSGPTLTGLGASGGIDPSSIAWDIESNSSPASMMSFAHFPVYVVDWQNGVTLMPDTYQVAKLGSHVDLRAQVRDATITSISWDTSHLTPIAHLSGASTYHLAFDWSGYISSPPMTTPYVTLSVTDNASHTETFTYRFLLPSGSQYVMTPGTAATWPTSLAPDLQLASSPSIESHNIAVDTTSGASDATLDLPSYNPNIPGLSLTYDSLTADPRPIVTFPHVLNDALAIPSKSSGQITVKDTSGVTKYTGSTWYYNTSQFIAGDIQQIALQSDMTGLSTDRYDYTATVVDYRTTNTTTTLTGTMTVLNQASSAIGSGWTVLGLGRLTAASGGMILDLGGGGRTLWFSGSPGAGGGTYTTPKGDFSTLAKTAGGTYTRTLTDGTVINFDSSGNQTSVVDTNGLRTTYTYSSGKLSTITDPYSKVTTFTYSGSYLQSIKDPANRLTTLTHTGANLTGATLPDGSAWAYAYDGSGRLTRVTDPNSKATTLVYDSAQRVGTITRPDSTNETVVAHQERGWTNSGTSGSPAAATLLAEARATYTDPNTNVTDLRPDWRGQGLTGTYVDPLGNVAYFDRDINGLATVTIDRLSREDLYTYDAAGNVTQHTYPDLKLDKYTYNSFAEVTSHTDANNHTTTYTYDGNGNLTVVKDALNNLTTMTYTANGRVATIKDANNRVTSLQYDSQDRLTTVTNADSTTVVSGYDSQGNVSSVTDERGNATTFAYDAMNRTTGSTDPLGNRTTWTYDSGGNLTVTQAPTPSGATARTTTIAYDAMNRAVTITAPLSRVTVYGYDAAGNPTKITDPMGRITTVSYDALNRPTVVTTPLTGASNAVTTTTYDAEGQALTVADPMNRVTTTTYNNRGWVATVTDPLTNVTTYSYTGTGKTSTITNPNSSGGSTDSYFYDNDDRLTTVTDALSHSTVRGYDAVGNQITFKDGNGNVTTMAYDSRNRFATVTDALGHATVYGYDSGGNRQTVKDALGNVTTTLYDALNRATTVIDPRGGTTTMAYDAASRMTGLTDPVGNRTTWAYDAADRMTTMTDPLEHSGTYVYDYDDELTDKTDRNGRRTTYTYDSGGRETGETWLASGGGVSNRVTYTYDADSEMTGVTDSYATLTMTYDSGGNQLTVAESGPGTGQPSITLTSTYDKYHNRLTLVDNVTSNVGRTTYTYDAAFRLTSIAASYNGTAGPRVVFGYDAADRKTSINRTIGGSGTAVNTTLVYDAANRVGTITHQTGGGTALATYVYGYDNADRVTTEVNAEGTVTYTYDSGGELLSARGSRTEDYSYDANGNRTMTGYSTGTGNELTASPGTTYTYDNEGNLQAQTNTSTHVVTTYTYDNRNRLTQVTTGGTVVATYTYDALDRRIGFKESGTQTWVAFDGASPNDNAYADFNGSGTLISRYEVGPVIDEVLARTSSGGTIAWYLEDRQGNMRDIANASGSVIDHVVYSSYGSIINETGPASGDRFKFTGREYTAIAALFYYRARYFDASSGRFISPDPGGYVDSTNLFKYAQNQPTGFTDPTGYDAETEQQQAQRAQQQNNIDKALAMLQAAMDSMTAKQRAETEALLKFHKEHPGYIMFYPDLKGARGAPADGQTRTGTTQAGEDKTWILIDEKYRNDPSAIVYILAHEGYHLSNIDDASERGHKQGEGRAMSAYEIIRKDETNRTPSLEDMYDKYNQGLPIPPLTPKPR